jgi:hypothetical protein
MSPFKRVMNVFNANQDFNVESSNLIGLELTKWSAEHLGEGNIHDFVREEDRVIII